MAPRWAAKLRIAALAGVGRAAAVAGPPLGQGGSATASARRSRSVPASRWDADGDGAISVPELLAAAELLGLDLKVAQDLGGPRSAPAPGGVNLVPRAEVGSDSAYLDCPCIDHVANASWAAVVAPYVTGDSPSEIQATDGTMFSRDYGSAVCEAWDEDSGFMGLCSRQFTASSISAGPPKFCKQKWCFVDEKRCSRMDVQSSVSFPGLSFSYEACGNVGTFSQAFNITGFLPIYLPYINISNGEHVVVVSKEPSTPVPALRAMLVMGSSMFDMLGVAPTSLRYRDISSTGFRYYTDCVYEIALGNIDMCVGDWWETVERANFGVPFVPVYRMKIRLVLRKGQRRENLVGTFGHTMTSLTSAIKPFEDNLWIWIVMTMLLASLVMAVVERAERKKGVAFGEAVHLACSSFASFSSAYSPQTPGGKVMGLGISFFLTIVGASFTANTAQFFIQEAASDGYHSFYSVFEDRKLVCLTDGDMLMRLLVEKYPQLGELVKVKSENNFFDQGDCFGWIIPENVLLDTMHTNQSHYCNYEFVGGSLFQFFVGYYVSPALYHPAMYAVTHLRYNGTWSSINRRVWRSEHAVSCSTAPAGPMQLTEWQMFGPNVGLMLCCVISFLLHTFCQAAKNVREFSVLSEPDDASSADAGDD